MRSRVVAIVAVGMLAAPLPAQAQSADLTMYGRLNFDLEYIHASGANPDVFRLSSNSSRLGVRGTESVGGGVRVVFQIEASIFADRGDGVLAGRETYLGLQTPWGTVKLGHMLGPYDDMHPIFGNEPTFTTSILSTSALWAQGTISKPEGGFDARLRNSIRYDSPNLSGFIGGIQLAYVFDDDVSITRHVQSAAVLYSNGPFLAGVAVERNKEVRGPGLEDWAFTAAGSWDFGVVRLAGVYERLDYETPTGSLKRNLYGISATAPVGRGALYAVWLHAAKGTGSGRVSGGWRAGRRPALTSGK